MKLLRNKKRFSDDSQLFHLIRHTEWKTYEKYGQNLMNFHISTFCGVVKILAKGDDYVPFDKKTHTKKICHDCYDVFKLRRKVS